MNIKLYLDIDSSILLSRLFLSKIKMALLFCFLIEKVYRKKIIVSLNSREKYAMGNDVSVLFFTDL
jgi:hypothetical protein